MSDMDRYKHDCVVFCRDILGKVEQIAFFYAKQRCLDAFDRLGVTVSELGLNMDKANETVRMLQRDLEQAAKFEKALRDAHTRDRTVSVEGEVNGWYLCYEKEDVQKALSAKGGYVFKRPMPVYDRKPEVLNCMPSKSVTCYELPSGRTLVQGLLTGGMK